MHRFVGYLEEEAVKTYTHALRDLDDGHLPGWATMPPPVSTHPPLPAAAHPQPLSPGGTRPPFPPPLSLTLSLSPLPFRSVPFLSPVAKEYWQLGEGATMRDLLLAVRADEAAHSHVNHTLASLPQSAVNPFRGGATKLPLPDFTRPPPGVDMATGRPVFANAPPSALGDV